MLITDVVRCKPDVLQIIAEHNGITHKKTVRCSELSKKVNSDDMQKHYFSYQLMRAILEIAKDADYYSGKIEFANWLPEIMKDEHNKKMINKANDMIFGVNKLKGE